MNYSKRKNNFPLVIAISLYLRLNFLVHIFFSFIGSNFGIVSVDHFLIFP
jgi:hypothetical protein